jgi:hypothetical protein
MCFHRSEGQGIKTCPTRTLPFSLRSQERGTTMSRGFFHHRARHRPGHLSGTP